MPHPPRRRPTTRAVDPLLWHRRDVHAPPRGSVCPAVHAPGALAQAGSNMLRVALTSCRALQNGVNGPCEVPPLAVPRDERAVTCSRELIDPAAAAVHR